MLIKIKSKYSNDNNIFEFLGETSVQAPTQKLLRCCVSCNYHIFSVIHVQHLKEFHKKLCICLPFLIQCWGLCMQQSWLGNVAKQQNIELGKCLMSQHRDCKSGLKWAFYLSFLSMISHFFSLLALATCRTHQVVYTECVNLTQRKPDVFIPET